MSVIELHSVSKSFGELQVLESFDLQVKEGKVHTLIGESGSGKTTILRLMNGLELPTEGRITVAKEELTKQKALSVRRRMGYTQQGSGLFPHMTVLENISIIARRDGWSHKDRWERARELMDSVHLPQDVLEKKPGQMSGGQRQRVSLARSLFSHPKILLMDEPFGALDPITRVEVQDLVLELKDKNNLTIVFVTHSLAEAFKMADTLTLINKGKIEQSGSVNSFLSRPATDFVRGFVKSNSPSQVLDSVRLYSIANDDLWVQLEGQESQLVHLNSKEEKEIKSSEQMRELLAGHEQQCLFVLSSEWKLKKVMSIDGKQEMKIETLQAEGRFLEALNKLIQSSLKTFPVVDKNHRFIGCFSEGAIHSI